MIKAKTFLLSNDQSPSFPKLPIILVGADHILVGADSCIVIVHPPLFISQFAFWLLLLFMLRSCCFVPVTKRDEDGGMEDVI